MAFPSADRNSNTSVNKSSSSSSSSAFASSSASAFSSLHTNHFRKSTTAAIARRNPALPSSQSVSFGFERDVSPSRSISAVSRDQVVKKDRKSQQTSSGKRMCMCSPTTHPGSFRCSLHKNSSVNQSSSSHHHRLNARRSAMTNSLVRIGTVEGDLVKRALAALIRPSSHQQRRRTSFQARPSRLSFMSRAEDDTCRLKCGE